MQWVQILAVSRRYTDFLNQKLGGQSTVLFASRGIPISQEERSGRKRDRELESFSSAGESVREAGFERSIRALGDALWSEE